jgi:hypothetical protein
MMHGARLLWLGAYLSCATLCACAIEEAHGASAAGPADAGRAEHETREDPCEASLVGMTRAAVKACRGRPTEQHGDEWVYAPREPGCREMIVSEVVRFKGGVVVSVGRRDKRTNKICGRAPSRER